MAAAKARSSGPSKDKIELYSPTYFGACTLGGVVACGPTHTGIMIPKLQKMLMLFTNERAAVTPLDLVGPTLAFTFCCRLCSRFVRIQVKCRRQVNPRIYSSNLSAWRSIYAKEGVRGVFFGWSPTFIGYSLQGAGKYGFYEVFKYIYGDRMFPNMNKTVVYLGASASAEFLADIALCPLEAIKVRMQTTIPPFANTLREGWGKVTAKEGVAGLYKGLYPLWGRQIPYTMVKFATFETTVNYIYATLGKPKESYNALQQTGVSFLGGYIAGIGCATISHPADVMVSKLNADRQREHVSKDQIT